MNEPNLELTLKEISFSSKKNKNEPLNKSVPLCCVYSSNLKILYGISKVVLERTNLPENNLLEERSMYFFHRINTVVHKSKKGKESKNTETLAHTFPVSIANSKLSQITDMVLTTNQTTLVALSNYSFFGESKIGIQDLDRIQGLKNSMHIIAYDIEADQPLVIDTLNVNDVFKNKNLGRGLRIKKMPLCNTFGIITDKKCFVIINYDENEQRFDMQHLFELEKDCSKFMSCSDGGSEYDNFEESKAQEGDFVFCGDFIYLMFKEMDLKLYEIVIKSKDYYAKQVAELFYKKVLVVEEQEKERQEIEVQKEQELINNVFEDGVFAPQQIKMSLGEESEELKELYQEVN